MGLFGERVYRLLRIQRQDQQFQDFVSHRASLYFWVFFLFFFFFFSISLENVKTSTPYKIHTHTQKKMMVKDEEEMSISGRVKATLINPTLIFNYFYFTLSPSLLRNF